MTSLPDPFCNQAAFSRTVFWESRHFRVLYDLRPVVRGHILFVTKRHILDITELSTEEVEDLHKTFNHIIPKVLSIYNSTGGSYDLTSQIGPYSGRSVEHLHIHMIPRKKGDEYQKSEKNIFEDLKLNKTSFTASEVDAEIVLLRKEFGFKAQ